jgi:hypothetical protein
MPFEMLLSQIVTLPNKFIILEAENHEEQMQELADFDRAMANLQTPTILLERLKREFDDMLVSSNDKKKHY